MKSIKSWIGLALAAGIMLNGSSAQAFWTPAAADPVPAGRIRIAVTPNIGSEVTSLYGAFSKVSATRYIPVQESVADCFTADAPGCDLKQAVAAGMSLEALAYYPICGDVYRSSCIDSFSVQLPGGKASETKFLRYAHPDFHIAPNAFPGLPGGESLPIFAVTDKTTGTARDYVLEARSRYTYDAKLNLFSPSNLAVVATPVTYTPQHHFCAPAESASPLAAQSGPFLGAKVIKACTPSGGFFYDGQVGAMQDDLDVGTRISVRLRVPSDLSGWISGQLANINAALSPLSANTDLLSLDAEAVTIPSLQMLVPDEMVKAGSSLGSLADLADEVRKYPNGRQFVFPAHSDNAFEAINKLRTAAQDKATAENVVWNFSTGRGWQGGSCNNSVKGITGIVSTNAMAYSGDQPSFENGVLDFKVAGMHFKPDGTVTRGQYSLIMRSKFARCLYGFTSAPVSANISVTQEQGVEEVAATTVVEKGDFIHLTANNFTFSEKFLKVQLLQKKSKLVCVKKIKGKIVKRVTVSTPKCPTGYVKG